MFLNPAHRPPIQPPGSLQCRNATTPAAKAARTAGLLVLLRKLFDYGKGVIAVLERQPPFTVEHVGKVALRFGTPNVRLIANRVMRGLQIALALKDRLAAAVAPPAAPTLPATPTPPSAPARAARPALRAPRPVPAYRRPAGPDRDDAIAAAEAADDAALLERLPTAKEIAARMLR
ncbi:MAG TPA: hypothetical protein VGG99_09890, partial [Acetobacteraceae bacterium]